MLINKFVSASYGKLLNCAKQITPKDVSEYAPGCVVQYSLLHAATQAVEIADAPACDDKCYYCGIKLLTARLSYVWHIFCIYSINKWRVRIWHL